MMVFTRKTGQEIIIGDDIRIVVIDHGNGRVKIGIDAPRSVRVDRAEVRAAKEASEEKPWNQ